MLFDLFFVTRFITRVPQAAAKRNIASSLFCYWTICLSSEVFLLSPVSLNVRICASSKGKKQVVAA
jgi:hypothetical protein